MLNAPLHNKTQLPKLSVMIPFNGKPNRGSKHAFIIII